MHDDFPQQIATFALVLGAGIYMFRRAWLMFHPDAEGQGGGCGGGCSSCSLSDASRAAPPTQVVSIGMPGSRKSG